jgi:hypothetical protein
MPNMRIEEVDSLILYLTDLRAARASYRDFPGWPILIEDEIVVLGDGSGRIVLHAMTVATMSAAFSRLDQKQELRPSGFPCPFQMPGRPGLSSRA